MLMINKITLKVSNQKVKFLRVRKVVAKGNLNRSAVRVIQLLPYPIRLSLTDLIFGEDWMPLQVGPIIGTSTFKLI